MDKAEQKIQMIDRLLANEQKSKRWTLIWVVLFSLMAILVFYFAWQLNQVSREKNILLEAKNDTLDLQSKTLLVRNDSLKQLNISLERFSAGFDSLQRVNDTLAGLLKKTSSDIGVSTPGARGVWINELYQDTYNRGTDISQDIQKITSQPAAVNSDNKKVYTVYLQCMPGKYLPVTRKLSKQLAEEGFVIPGLETIEKITFNSQVKYFNDEDREKAEEVARLVNKFTGDFKNSKVTVERFAIKAPLHQLEVWVGEYAQKDINQLLKQVPLYKN